MNKLIVLGARVICVGGMISLCGGCVSAIVDAAMAKQGFHRATREQMLRESTPSFAAPEVRKALAPLPKEKLVGKWSSSRVMDTRTALLSLGYDGPSMTMTSHTTYWLFEDGVAKMLIKMNGNETTWNGDWDYRDGILTISGAGGDGKKHEADMKVLWYGNNEFELRHADLSKYEAMLGVGGAKSVKCRYEANGILHTQMIITANDRQNDGATIMVEGPQIFERDGEVE